MLKPLDDKRSEQVRQGLPYAFWTPLSAAETEGVFACVGKHPDWVIGYAETPIPYGAVTYPEGHTYQLSPELLAEVRACCEVKGVKATGR